MLKFVKQMSGGLARTASPHQDRPEHARPPPVGRGARPAHAEPVPLPEVTEGNEESDWALWENSVAFQDSQMSSSFDELDPVKQTEPTPGDEDIDPFATVRRRGA